MIESTARMLPMAAITAMKAILLASNETMQVNNRFSGEPVSYLRVATQKTVALETGKAFEMICKHTYPELACRY